ncbi:hypothetical protein HY639_05440 [Candidatus Woesearchaeota archaeon]|nr:hypothetical protein [Candidatus Woesearchaeota archaeon]
MNKKGQEGGGAAALVALIALFMVLYIILLPPAERGKLLGEPEGPDGTNTSQSNELLLTHPGRVIPKGDLIALHPLPSIVLATKVESTELSTWDSLSVRRSIFANVQQDISFTLQDPGNTDNVLLNFLVAKGAGVLTVTLNGEQVFSREVTTRNIEPIKLRKALLRKDNILTFAVSSPGASFWRANAYTLTAITLRGDMTDKTKQAAQSIFYVGPDEKRELKRATLDFSVLCDPTEIGRVAVSLNGKQLYDAAPSCNALNRLEVPIDYVAAGQNSITWASDMGMYKFDIIRMEMNLREPQNYRAYFSLTPEQFNRAVPIVMTLVFPGDERRQARVFVNDILLNLDTGAREFGIDITDFVRRGYNAIEIDPAVPFDIQELMVEQLE